MEGVGYYVEGRKYVWSVVNPCRSCSRDMYRHGKIEPDKTPYHAKGHCSTCYQKIDKVVSTYEVALVRDDLTQICTKCSIRLSLSDFAINQGTLSGKSTWCRKCTTLNKFKMTRVDFDRIIQEQGGVCLICKEDPRILGRVFCVDHDRSCCPTEKSCGGCVRGLLCGSCNSGLGYFRDSTESLANAIKYLEEKDVKNQ